MKILTLISHLYRRVCGAVSCRAHAGCRVMILFPSNGESAAPQMIKACARLAYRVPISKGDPLFLVSCTDIFVILYYRIRACWQLPGSLKICTMTDSCLRILHIRQFSLVRSMFLTLCAEPFSKFHSTGTSAGIMKILAFCGGASNIDV